MEGSPGHEGPPVITPFVAHPKQFNLCPLNDQPPPTCANTPGGHFCGPRTVCLCASVCPPMNCESPDSQGSRIGDWCPRSVSGPFPIGTTCCRRSPAGSVPPALPEEQRRRAQAPTLGSYALLCRGLRLVRTV